MRTLFYRMHSGRVSEAEFLAEASSWRWDFDEAGALYERQLPGVYSAFERPVDLLTYYDGSNDDLDVAIFEGEVVDRPQSDARNEVLVRPTRLAGWTSVRELAAEAGWTL